ncbi:MAG TPA: histone H1 [Fibrobacteria bacterium]|nr:histone H1 [Fibrobacteria bacterium]HOX50386.1 histone H1 [Fibrobacteria bacterium]
MSLEKIDSLKSLVEQLRVEYEKFETKSNAVAGTRARKLLQDIKAEAQALREIIQERKRQKEMLGE